MSYSTDSYKLTYFNLRGIAEPIRFMFAYKQVPFEDEQIDYLEWERFKNDTFGGYLPHLEVNGVRITQSVAISRFLARRFNLMPQGEFEVAKCDEIVDTVQDLRLAVKPFIIEQDEAKKNEMRTQLMNEAIPKYLSKLEHLISERKGPYAVGNNISWTDFWTSNFLNIWVELFGSQILKKYPFLEANLKSVFSIHEIEDWNRRRPKTFV